MSAGHAHHWPTSSAALTTRLLGGSGISRAPPSTLPFTGAIIPFHHSTSPNVFTSKNPHRQDFYSHHPSSLSQSVARITAIHPAIRTSTVLSLVAAHVPSTASRGPALNPASPRPLPERYSARTRRPPSHKRCKADPTQAPRVRRRAGSCHSRSFHYPQRRRYPSRLSRPLHLSTAQRYILERRTSRSFTRRERASKGGAGREEASHGGNRIDTSR